MAKIPTLDFVRSANLSISSILSSTSFGSLAQQASEASAIWKKEIGLIDMSQKSLASAHFALQDHFLKASVFSTLAEASLARTNWSKLIPKIDLPTGLLASLQDHSLKLSESYSSLFKSFEGKYDRVLNLPPLVSSGPPVELYYNANLADVLTNEEPASFEEEKPTLDHTHSEIEQTFHGYLAKLNPKLLQLWNGAVESLASSNSDKARHFIISLRELQTHVLHELAPDNQIRSWSSSSQYYHDNKPTRRARLEYIYRNVSHKPFTDFVEQDIKSHLAFIDLFQRGTHELDSQFNDDQLNAMKSRTEALLKFILEIAYASGGA